MLGDDEKRILYDAGGMELVKQGVQDNQPQHMDPFAAMFGGGQQRRSNRGPDATVRAPKQNRGRNKRSTGLSTRHCANHAPC